jgi:hypothetical protein
MRKITIFTTVLFSVGLLFSCEGKIECYTCVDCTGQFANVLEGQTYCSDGFDSKSDWEAMYEERKNDGVCTCTKDE